MDNNLKVERAEMRYSYNDVLEGICNLSDEEKSVLFENIKVNDMVCLLQDDASVNNYINIITEHSNKVIKMAEAMLHLQSLLKHPKKAEENIVSEYDKLDEAERKATALQLLNNGDFQKNCCEILVKDFERIINEDASLKALDSLLGLSKFYKRNIERGIGCDHKYEV